MVLVHGREDANSKGDREQRPDMARSSDIPPCQHPMEAVQDLRYRPDDTSCPICHGRLPRMGNLHKKEDKLLSAPTVWKVAPKGERWEDTGPHHAVKSTPAVQQRLDLQRLSPHYESNAGSHFEKGVKLAREAALSKSAKSQEAMLQQAAGWFRSAAFLGHLKATYQIGMFYLEGRGTPLNHQEGVAFLRKAAKGDAEAAFELGQCYHLGRGVAEDPDQAATWWRKAQEMGHLHAQETLNRSAAAAASASQHAQTAQIKQRADGGDPEAQYQVAVRLTEGISMARDEREAAAYYRRAATQGHAGAQCGLALCHMYGRGVGSDVAEAVRWMTQAADAGHGVALAELAEMCEEGVGVQRDADRARSLRRQADKCESTRVLEYYRSRAHPRRGRVTVKASDLEPHLDYVRDKLRHLRRTLAVVEVAKQLLACSLRRRLRRNPQALLDTDRQKWHAARERTVAVERHLSSLFHPACLLMGREPHPLTADEASALLADVDAMGGKMRGGHAFDKSREGRWDRAAHQVAVGRQHGAAGSVAEAAVQAYGERMLELEWEGGQVEGGRELRALDYVDFVVRFDRQSGTMHAVTIAPMVLGQAPLPGALLVLPRGPEPDKELAATDRRKQAREAEVGGILAREQRGDGVDAERRERAVAGLERAAEEHAWRREQANRLRSEWWAETWSESRERVLGDNDALLGASSVSEEQWQRVRGQVTHVEDGDPDAQLELGCMYVRGEGTTRSAERAVHWFERAAKQGQPQAKCALGVCFAVGDGVPREDRQKAQRLFEEAAGMGLALAHTYLADMQRYGSGLGQPDHLAMLDHIRHAVLASSKPSNAFNRAGNRLGELHSHAGVLPGSTKFSLERDRRLVPRDDAKATSLFVEASKTPGVDAKYARALTNLGEMREYKRTPMMQRDGESEAARARWRDACEDIALEMYEEASGAPANDERALSNLRAMPSHLSNMAGTTMMGWEDYVDDVEKRLTSIFADP